MFNGIVEEIGEIIKIDKSKIFIKSTPNFLKKEIASSVAIDGACFTIIEVDEDAFCVEVSEETLNRTIAKNYQIKSKVNLESPLIAGRDISGHFVSGHIDLKAKILGKEEKENETILKIELPKEIRKFVAFKGSICLNGVSLTISSLQENSFEVCLIPHTLKTTNLQCLKVNDEVNLEIDLLARYLGKMIEERQKQTEYQYLVERGFI